MKKPVTVKIDIAKVNMGNTKALMVFEIPELNISIYVLKNANHEFEIGTSHTYPASSLFCPRSLVGFNAKAYLVDRLNQDAIDNSYGFVVSAIIDYAMGKRPEDLGEYTWSRNGLDRDAGTAGEFDTLEISFDGVGNDPHWPLGYDRPLRKPVPRLSLRKCNLKNLRPIYLR